MIKKLIHIIACSLSLGLLCLLSGCGDNEDLPPQKGQQAGDISFVFSVNNSLTKTRTTLSGSVDMQHVQSVRLYVFEGEGEDAPCVASEDIGWSEHFGATSLPTATASMTYKVKYKGFVAGQPYTFLAVGMDNQSGATYGLPGAIAEGSILSATVANLASGKGCSDIAQSELFTGVVALTPIQSGFTGQIDLYRRVAGVMGWFTNVPTTIDGATVANIKIVLHQKQNTQVPLVQRGQSPVFHDYITSPATETAGEVLVLIPAPNDVTKTVSAGSYVLPATAPAESTTGESKYSLKVLLTSTDGTVLKTLHVKLGTDDVTGDGTGSGTGIIDTESSYRFPIVANHFYGVGSEGKPIDLGGDGNEIIITVNPNWSGTIDVPFE